MIFLIPNFGSWLLQLISVYYITGLSPEPASIIVVRPTPTDKQKIFLERNPCIVVVASTFIFVLL